MKVQFRGTKDSANMKTKPTLRPRAFHIPIGRRRFFTSMAAVSAGFTLPGYLAEALTIAPSVTQGPYYPTPATMPLEKDNDLIYVNDSLTMANVGNSVTNWSSSYLTNMSLGGLPFSLTQARAVNASKITASSNV